MTNEQIKVTKAIIAAPDDFLFQLGMTANVHETLAGNYILVYLNGDNLTLSSNLSQTGHPEGISFPTFSEQAVLQWADLDEGEEVAMDELVSDYVTEVYVPEQRLRLEAMLEAATA